MMRRTLGPALMLAGILFVLTQGCTATRPMWSAITDTPTDVHIQGRWVWAELLADNVGMEKDFYHKVFGWRFESKGTGTQTYDLVRADGRPIAGIVHFAKHAGSERAAKWLPMMSVPDTARAAEEAVKSGGKVIVASRALPGRGEAAVLADPEGAAFGVLHSSSGDPRDEFPDIDTWFWMELWAKDAQKMADFYRPLGNYEVTRQEGPGDREELHLVAGGYPRADILEVLRKDLPSTWLPYVRVKDLQKTVDTVIEAGGYVVIEPSPDIRNGKVAVFLDPLGAAFAAAEWTDEAAEEGKP